MSYYEVSVAGSNIGTEMSSFWWNFHHCLHWKLSKWQLSVQSVVKISSKWHHFHFSEVWSMFYIPNCIAVLNILLYWTMIVANGTPLYIQYKRHKSGVALVHFGLFSFHWHWGNNLIAPLPENWAWSEWLSLTVFVGHPGPFNLYKLSNHRLYIGIIIFPHIGNTQYIDYN